MTLDDLLVLLPFLVLAAATVVVMLAIAVYRHHLLTAALTAVSLVLAFGSLFVVPSVASPRQVTPLFVVDGYALFFLGLLFAASFAVILLSYGYLEKQEGNREEYYLLLLLATLGSAVLVASTHFASFFLGLETLSVSLYALIAYPRLRENSTEAGVKYLVLAGASSAFLLFGMALIYAQLGTMEFSRIASAQAADGNPHSPLVLSGSAMLIVGIGFKLAVVPFHMWTPDVYEGAPAPVTAFVATLSKGGVFALLLRYFTQVDLRSYSSLFVAIGVIAFASMLAGNLLALLQNNVKRLLAYSSIAHLGYLLVAFMAGGPLGATAVAFYLVAYFVTSLGAFGVVTLLSGPDRDADSLEDYRGLVWRQPWLAGVFTAMLLSLAGIPLTAGFVGKFYLLAAGVGPGLWLLVITLVVTSAIGLFYYLRVVTIMYMRPAEEEGATAVPTLSRVGSLAVVALALVLVWLGVYPTQVIQMIQATVAGLV